MAVDGFSSVRENITNVQTPGCITLANVPLARPVTRSGLHHGWRNRRHPLSGKVAKSLYNRLSIPEVAFDCVLSSVSPGFMSKSLQTAIFTISSFY